MVASQNDMIGQLARKMVDGFESRTSWDVRPDSSKASVSEARAETEISKIVKNHVTGTIFYLK